MIYGGDIKTEKRVYKGSFIHRKVAYNKMKALSQEIRKF